MTCRVLSAVVVLSIGLAATSETLAGPPIHPVVGTVESVGPLDAPGGVTIVIRQAASPTPVTVLVPRPEVPPEYREVVEGLTTHGPAPRPGDVIRATGWVAIGQPVVAYVVEVRDGPLCTGRCADYLDGARGYRLWLHRSFIDLTRAVHKETVLWVTMSQILARHDRLESSRMTAWLVDSADRLFGEYTDPRKMDAWIPTLGTPDLRESVPRLARLAKELGPKPVLILGIPFMPSDWGQVFVGYWWGYFPLQVYVPDKPLRRVF